MPQFKIHISETISGIITVEADTKEEALDIATEQYLNGEFVMEPQIPDCKIECDD